MNWKDKIDNVVKEHLDLQIRKTYDQEEAFNKADNKANAQLWIAIANLSREIFELNLKLKYLEKKQKNKKIKNLKRY
nr:hypothetical protein [Candidatus Woesearchaeota archaeon]